MPEGLSSQKHSWAPLIYVDSRKPDGLVQRATYEVHVRASDSAIS